MSANIKITYTEKIVPDAYHGTSKEKADIIIRTGIFEKSTGSKQYLGDGVYFFESQREHAVRWARENFRGDVLGIIRALVNLGKCLNVTLPEIKTVLLRIKNELEKRYDVPITDAAVINFVATNIAKADTVKAVILSKKNIYTLYTGSNIPIGEQIIICVRNRDRILEKELVYTTR